MHVVKLFASCSPHARRLALACFDIMPTLKNALKKAAASGKTSLRSCEQFTAADNLSRELAQYTDISTPYGPDNIMS